MWCNVVKIVVKICKLDEQIKCVVEIYVVKIVVKICKLDEQIKCVV